VRGEGPARQGLDLDLSGIRVRLRGLADSLLQRVRAEWARFVAEPSRNEPFLELEVGYQGNPVSDAAWDPKSMTSELRGTVARFQMAEGRATVDLSGPARLTLAPELGPREFYTLANLIRAALAWRLPSRQGMLLHAAGVVLQGESFLLVGAEGSGKSTWTRLAASRAERVLSDDLVLVDGSGPRLEALGAPFRSTHESDYRPGRWPLAAIYFPRHGTTAALRATSEMIATARLTANLPFITDVVVGDERVRGLLERVLREVVCAELTFAPDESFLNLMRSPGPLE
jgi:hypothetical protein